MTTIATVFTWSSGHPTTSDRVPAILGWTNELLVRAAAQLDISPKPSVSIRRAALFGWLTSEVPESRRAGAAGRNRFQLSVDADEAAVARVDLLDELLSPPQWKELTIYLGEYSFDPELVEEELTPVADPLASMMADRTEAAVSSTDDRMIEAVLGYFRLPLQRYLESWRALSAPDQSASGLWEAIVPMQAVVSIEPA